jgi:hypothetical protein
MTLQGFNNSLDLIKDIFDNNQIFSEGLSHSYNLLVIEFLLNYITQTVTHLNYWVSRLCPISRILNTRKRNFWELDLFGPVTELSSF